MSIPKLTTFIGENASTGNENEFSSIIKAVKKPKEKEQQYIVFLVFDLMKEQIYFKLDKKLTQDSVYNYYYFGNNSAASSQYYLTREESSIKYLISSTLSDLYQMLSKYDMENDQLGDIIKKIEEKEMIYLTNKKGEGKLNLDKFSIVVNKKVEKIELDEKLNVVIDAKRYNTEAFIRIFINDENKSNKFVLIVPKVILENGEEIILSTHDEYLELVKKKNNLGSSIKESIGEGKVCYICKEKKASVSSDYSKKFSRTGINKFFTTTTINTSQYLQKYNYDNTYSVCSSCYQKLLAGEKIISNQFKAKIAGEDVFIIPQGILETFDYRYLNILKKDIDLAFKSSNAKNWITEIESEQDEGCINNYSINFIIYRTDGNSVMVLQTMEDVPTIRFKRIMEVLADCTSKLKPYIDNISIGSIYRLIPVRVNKKGEQLDIGRVLSLYKAMFCGEKINHKILYDYAIEGLDKGLKQLSKSRIDNYYNMNLINYCNGYEDFFIKRLIFGYITLIKACQKLGLLDREIYKPVKKEGYIVNIINTPSDIVNSSIIDIEKFLDKQGFDDEERALFYIGTLVNRIALVQYNKGHKTKPILKKIQFQGMNEKEVYMLYQDVVEKLRQYDEMKLFNEAVMNRFHYYYGSLKRQWSLNDHANVFYIMSGYSYMVGRKAEGVNREEQETQIEFFEHINNEE